MIKYRYYTIGLILLTTTIVSMFVSLNKSIMWERIFEISLGFFIVLAVCIANSIESKRMQVRKLLTCVAIYIGGIKFVNAFPCSGINIDYERKQGDKFLIIFDDIRDMRVSDALLRRLHLLHKSFTTTQRTVDFILKNSTVFSSNTIKLERAHADLAKMLHPTLFWFLSDWCNWVLNNIIVSLKIAWLEEPHYRGSKRCKRCRYNFLDNRKII